MPVFVAKLAFFLAVFECVGAVFGFFFLFGLLDFMAELGCFVVGI